MIFLLLFELLPLVMLQLNVAVPIAQKITLRIGVAAVENTEIGSIDWPTSGGAINMAITKLKQDGYIAPFEFEFYVNYTECDRSLGASAGMDFMRTKRVDAVIGPPCQDPMEVISTMATYYQTPLLAWGLVTDSKFTDGDRYPYLTNIMANSLSLGYSLVKLLELMEWDKIALYYEVSDQDYPLSIINDVESAINDPESYAADVVVKQSLPIGNSSDAAYISALNRSKTRARVLISVVTTATSRRKYLQMVLQQGMTSSEYVHIMLSLRSTGFGKQVAGQTKCELNCLSSGLTPFWELEVDDGLNAKLKDAATRLLVLDLSTDVPDVDYLNYFTTNAMKEVVNPPISCTTPACVAAANKSASAFSRSLHDLFYLYGMAITNLYNTNPNLLANRMSVVNAMQLTFLGLTGEVSINSNNTRVPKLMLYALNKNYDQSSFMNLTYSLSGGASVSIGYTSESSLWYWYNGKRPLATPICGFSGTSCPQSFVDQYGALLFAVGGVLVLALLLLVTCFFYTLRQRKLERDRINAEWQIPHIKLQLPARRDKNRMSKRSLLSGPSTMTDASKITYEQNFTNFKIYELDKEPVLTTKHPASNLYKQDYEQFVKLRKLDHVNVNKFVGMSIDGPDYFTVWKMCRRGSLEDIIVQGNFSIDPFFMFCIIRDIAEGLKYLHNSFLHLHGNLRSATCLVNDSWQAKLVDYGLGFLMEDDKPMKKRQLYVAPEVLRGSSLSHQMDRTADIYSFGIVASEVVTRKRAWNLGERKEGVDEILYLLKKGGNNPPRPELDLDGVDVNVNLLHLIRDCWTEDPLDRPSIETICANLRGLNGKKTNLMDHVFEILEEYTTNLEIEVEERTKELKEEKKKADILLSRMLPKQVAERLKQGQTVEPEGFDSVTVFFSDVVKFTQLAAKCSPFQVVNLLNDLYSNFDSIIEEKGVYKVESIGDGYLCVSGLPNRNGHNHIQDIVDLSLDFMAYVKSFKVPHLPREKVELRIGINSGPCVAGVVGLSMPRYCLFGDTVNTASRMESNGKASHIHMSKDAHDLLMTHYGREYETQSRGDVIIKGKGVMETFWVHRKVGTGGNQRTPAEEPLKRTPKNETDQKEMHHDIKVIDHYSLDFGTNSSPSPSTQSPKTPPLVRQRMKSFQERSISPMFESTDRDMHNQTNEALYRKFRRQETLALM